MAKKKSEIYDLTNDVKKEIIEYCYAILNSINKKYLIETNIYENEFLEYLFMGCKKIFLEKGEFELDEEDIIHLMHSKQQGDRIVEELEQGNVKLIGINKDDDLIFEFKNKEVLENFEKIKNDK